MPRREDFFSDRQAGKEPRDLSPGAVRRNAGLSVWGTKEGALSVIRRFPRLGERYQFVAEIELPASATIEPYPRRPEHLTAYGDADAFVESVIRVEPVDSP